MTILSRRHVLAGLAASSVASIATAFGEQASGAVHLPSDVERKKSAESLLRYFAANAPQLLRAPGGILKYPSIAPSLPGKQYSAQLWDWDTLWTSRGLFRVAELEHDEALKQKLFEPRLRQPAELSRPCLSRRPNPHPDDAHRRGPF